MHGGTCIKHEIVLCSQRTLRAGIDFFFFSQLSRILFFLGAGIEMPFQWKQFGYEMLSGKLQRVRGEREIMFSVESLFPR